MQLSDRQNAEQDFYSKMRELKWSSTEKAIARRASRNGSDQLVAWVRIWEPQEVSRMPIASALPPGKPILLVSRLYQQQAEQEWQRVRKAFEARHKKPRSSPKIFWEN